MVPTSFGTIMKPVASVLFVTLLLIGQAKGTRYTPPGKPRLTSCRSPEKETFTCWWEPGSDGGLATTYALYYRKENSDMVYECPDYQTAGENSCFFNKNNTSIWINYNITVVATNPLGSNLSEPVEVDVVYIVQPHTPENVTVALIEDKDGPFFKVSWEPPHKADTRSGWITLIYELRVKLVGNEEWEEHRAGQQKTFNIFSLRSGGTYLLQVRCKPDHGFWSEWSSTTYINVPDYIPYERSMPIIITVLSAVIFLTLACILNMKIHSVKHCLLPPVPGPKINGFDKQLLKDGRCEEVYNALVVPGFPITTMPDCEDLLVEGLEVNAPEEQELMLEECKDLREGCTKSKCSPSDSDSGRGSCESHILLMEKCGEVEVKEYERKMEADIGQRSRWEEREISQAQREGISPDMCDGSLGRVKTWPCVFSPPPLHHQYSSRSLASGLDEFHAGEKRSEQLRVSQTQPHVHLQEAHSQYDIPSVGHKEATGKLQLAPCQSKEYVEVHEVSKDDMVLLQPLSSDQVQGDDMVLQGDDMVLLQHLSSDQGQGDALTQLPQGQEDALTQLSHRQGEAISQLSEGEDYSKVKGLASHNVLLLQRELEARGQEREGCPCDHEEREGTIQSCCTMSATLTTQTPWNKPNVSTRIHMMPLQEEMVLAENGYVDTTTILLNR